jgi:hypothetical protein
MQQQQIAVHQMTHQQLVWQQQQQQQPIWQLPVLCVCTELAAALQRLLKATDPPRPQGTKSLEKGDLACAAVSCIYFLLLSA